MSVRNRIMIELRIVTHLSDTCRSNIWVYFTYLSAMSWCHRDAGGYTGQADAHSAI